MLSLHFYVMGTHTCTKLEYNYCTTNVGLNLYGSSDWRLGNRCAKKPKEWEDEKRREEDMKSRVLITKPKPVFILSSAVRVFCLDKAC